MTRWVKFIQMTLGLVMALWAYSAGAQTVILDDTFNRGPTTVGSGANSTTGIGNGWIDTTGNIWSIPTVGQLNASSGGVGNPCYWSGSGGQMQTEECAVTWVYTGTSANTSVGPVVKLQDKNDYYVAYLYGGALYINKVIGGTAVYLASVAASGFSVSVGQSVTVVLYANTNAGATTLIAYLFVGTMSAPSGTIWTVTTTDSTSNLQTAGYCGISSYASNAINYVSEAKIWNGLYIPGNVLTSGAATLTSANATTVTATVGAATGGTSPYTYAWYYSSSISVTPNTAIAGQTSTTLTWNPPTGGNYYVRCIASDSAGHTAPSNTILVATNGGNLVIGFIGDSITQRTDSSGNPIAYYECQILKYVGNFHNVSFVNQGISGTKTSDWLPTNSNNYFNNAVAAFQSAGVTIVSICLGANDANGGVAASTYQSNLQAIVNQLVADGFKVILNNAPYFQVSNTSVDALLESSYPAAVAAVVASNPKSVYQGAMYAYRYFAQHTNELADSIHPNDTGIQSYAKMWAQAFIQAFLVPGKRPLGGGLVH
ncbi:MAG TPA: SGNH/GDSL hydrolase family protein [Chthonomonas sp.]|uniref:SGNH/GDSL hydrolase family protein n=1 Tax=Chthonomonas sp. TaxID=2282153 RepID=UPI002B4AE515|nr:SGNH/GDSL hydrolase family protein [Chthonomonas sp.]HLI49847.1 SGNH/GDSL hydrolase family protein [Chthonomonas sp.]